MVNHEATGSLQSPVPHARWLWLRWSWRDLRQHWAAVLAIALVLAIGIGVYAGLGSTSTWRRESNDASFAVLDMHDLRISLSPGTFTDEGVLLSALDDVASDVGDGQIEQAAERLVVDSQIDASAGNESILAAARVVGMDVGDPSTVDALWVSDGDAPAPAAASGVGVLEAKFADHWGLDPSGSLIVAGGFAIDYVGVGASPEDFFYEGPEGTLLSEGELAPLYVSIATAQEIAGRIGQVNDLVISLAPGVDRGVVADSLRTSIAAREMSATVSTRDDAVAVRVLYEDIDNDQQFWNALATLVLLAAALAAFNLISRIVEAQRREIGIGMALGVPRRLLTIRPMLVGAQVAVLGTLFGVGVGLLVGEAMGNLLESFLPLPIHRTPFQFGVFARAAVLGLSIPMIASAIPVWRAVRVEPIEAIRTGHLTARTSRLTDWTARIKLPGSSLTHMPIRNAVRTPRRTILTAMGVGAAITALVAVLGMLDSFGATIDEANAEFTKGDARRVLVQMDTFYSADSDVIAEVGDAAAVGAVDAGLRLPVTAIASGEGDDIEVLLELVDFDQAAWTPTLERSTADIRSGSSGDGVVLASKAAGDLGVRLGDTIRLRHPVRDASGSFALTESDVPVTGIHANPMRAFAFMDLDQAERFGLTGEVNFVHAYPADGATRSELQRALFGLEGVTSSQSVARIGESFDEALEQFVGFLAITAGAVLILALLIAFNATRITVEERRREHATMRAFGLPVRTIVGVVVKESVLIGVAATAIGLAAGSVFLGWMLRSLASTTLPDLQIDSYISPATVAIAAVIGIVAVAAAPLLLVQRIRRMSIPDTLRVME